MGAHRLSLPWQVTGRWRALSPPVKFESRIRRGLGLRASNLEEARGTASSAERLSLSSPGLIEEGED